MMWILKCRGMAINKKQERNWNSMVFFAKERQEKIGEERNRKSGRDIK